MNINIEKYTESLEKYIELVSEAKEGRYDLNGYDLHVIEAALVQFLDESIFNNVSKADEFLLFSKKCAHKKYEEGTEYFDIAYKSILFGMSCFIAKKYWQQNMYSESDVRMFLNQCRHLTESIDDFNEQDWFDENKDKDHDIDTNKT